MRVPSQQFSNAEQGATVRNAAPADVRSNHHLAQKRPIENAPDTSHPMTQDPNLDLAVRRELLRLGMVNSARSVPIQLLAVVIVGGLGYLVES